MYTTVHSSRFNIGVDGLPCYDDAVQIRLKELKSLHLKEVRELTIKLKKATDKVHYLILHGCRCIVRGALS